MSADHHGGKGYAPLPQSISNTDTEDEEECLSQPIESLKERTDAAATELTTVQENGVYYPLDETRNLANRTRNGQNTLKYYRDDIPIMVIEGNDQNDLWKRRDMSPLRRLCLIASILLCIMTILVFLYVLPCDNSMVCPPVVEPQSSISWDRTLQGVELYGPISVIPDAPYNLIFLLHGQKFRGNDTTIEGQRQILPGGGGVMSMRGSTGLPLWLVPLKKLPTEIDCISIDTDCSGKPDCVVAGEEGLLISIEPIAGTIHWTSTVHTFSKLPVVLPDLNSDGVEDFLSVEIMVQHRPGLVILSGKTGQLLGRYVPGNCSVIDIYHLVHNDTISYVCQDKEKHIVRSMSFKGLLHAMKLSQAHKKLSAKSSGASYRMFQTVEHDDEKYKSHLTVENEGTCPGESCKATVNFTLQKFTNQPETIWDHVSPNSYASKPAFLLVPGKPYTFGFAIKFWQWNDTPGRVQKKVSSVTEHRLIERVLIVFVNYTDVQVTNASQTDIIQICRGSDCQPNLKSRARFSSISIAYISDDGLPELINYWSSYDVESPKLLTSKVQVVKLDSIISNLPATYA